MNTIQGNEPPHQEVAKHEWMVYTSFLAILSFGNMVLMIECVAPPPTLLVCWNVYCIPEGCVCV